MTFDEFIEEFAKARIGIFSLEYESFEEISPPPSTEWLWVARWKNAHYKKNYSGTGKTPKEAMENLVANIRHEWRRIAEVEKYYRESWGV